MELLQLIREAKYPDRMGIEIPESAKIVLFQEEKLKSYYNELSWASSEYEAALQRHGVQAPLRHGQQRLEQLVTNIYDIIQRRVEKNLRVGSRTLLVDGWWRHLRKPHYTADLAMALVLGLACGGGSVLPLSLIHI